MSKHTIFLVGATGETGVEILEALIKDGSFDITCFVRTSSAGKPAVQALKDRGLKVVTGDITGSLDELVPLLKGIQTIVSAIFPFDILGQIPLVDAAVQAGVKRFLPCNWGTPAARGGIMKARDEKEEVHDHIFRNKLGFTIVDVGNWHQVSFPCVPSGKFDSAALISRSIVYAGGTAPNMLIDKRDLGNIVVKIIKDERTLNRRVIAYAEVLSQNEINAIVEEKTGEKLELTYVSAEQLLKDVQAARAAAKAEPDNIANKYRLITNEYHETKYIREDNTPKNAEYLGYIDGRELYPNFEYIQFADFVDDLIAGKIKRPYPYLQLP